MDSEDRSCIFFHKQGAGLADAEAALRAKGLPFSKEGDGLEIAREGGPHLHLRFVYGAGVRKDAVRLGRGKELEPLLRRCDAAYVITFENLDQVLADGNLLIEVQLALQAATEGVISRSWNDELSGPEDAA
jgi:hypothetical protein